MLIDVFHRCHPLLYSFKITINQCLSGACLSQLLNVYGLLFKLYNYSIMIGIRLLTCVCLLFVG